MNTHAIQAPTLGQKEEKPFVFNFDGDCCASFTEMKGQTILCKSGTLWVTIENDAKDHVIREGQRLMILSMGKVVIDGPGRYAIAPATHLSLAS